MKKIRIWKYLNPYTKYHIIKWKVIFVFLFGLFLVFSTIFTILASIYLLPLWCITKELIKECIKGYKENLKEYKKFLSGYCFNIKCKKCNTICYEEWKTKNDFEILEKYKEILKVYFIEGCGFCEKNYS